MWVVFRKNVNANVPKKLKETFFLMCCLLRSQNTTVVLIFWESAATLFCFPSTFLGSYPPPPPHRFYRLLKAAHGSLVSVSTSFSFYPLVFTRFHLNSSNTSYLFFNRPFSNKLKTIYLRQSGRAHVEARPKNCHSVYFR